MNISIELTPCQKGSVIPLAPPECALPWAIKVREGLQDGEIMRAGLAIARDNEQIPLFTVFDSVCLPLVSDNAPIYYSPCPLLLAERDISSSMWISAQLIKNGYSLAIITLSDKGSQGLRRDESGPLLAEMVRAALPIAFTGHFLLPDDPQKLKSLFARLALELRYDLILTTGGTGVGPRDNTPEATRPLLDRELPGFSQAMMAASLAHTPNAAISRGLAGLMGQSLVINFPGSKKAVCENLEAILPAIPHTLKKIHGDPADCGA